VSQPTRNAQKIATVTEKRAGEFWGVIEGAKPPWPERRVAGSKRGNSFLGAEIKTPRLMSVASGETLALRHLTQ
jgi:hypothetical protein